MLEKRKSQIYKLIWIKMDDLEEGGSCLTNSKHCAMMV